ncbi:MAG TPA: DUF423 domain-containing protein [Phenylobacterium sp.]|jgi:uncharacterized membrane protein YgdD (TMEM256/DUF423 family)
MGLWHRRNWLSLAAVGGFLSVGFGAFAAHGIADPRSQELLRTGSLYGFIHCLATFASAAVQQMGAQRARFAPALFLSGVVLFSGSLYAMALGAPAWLGAVTPIGGLCFLAGWAVLAWAARGVGSPPSG